MTILLATFGNFFGPDMIVIFLIVLLLFGAKKLPELARGLGQSLNEFKKAREDFEHEIRTGQQDVQAKEAGNKQAYGINTPPVSAPAQALPYHQGTEPNPATAVANAQVLQQQVEQLQEQLRALQQQKDEHTHVG